ncbi:MAG: type VI secretion system tube protein Hcp [Chloroflexi bacterium]|nr:type VI secretion system tube protein Hcp [Chloroflexota bacterium]
MSITGNNFNRALLVLAVISAFTLAVVIAVAGPGGSDRVVIADTNTSSSDGLTANNGIFAKFTINGITVVGANSIVQIGGEDVSAFTELVWAGFSGNATIDPTTHLATGKNIYDPFTIVKSIDKATPQLMRALDKHEVVTAEIRIYRPTISGATDVSTMYVLTGGFIASQRINSFENTSNSAGEFNNTESIAIQFDALEITDVPTGESYLMALSNNQ